MLGRKINSSVFGTLAKIMELEKVDYGIFYLDDCDEKNLIQKMKSSDIFLFYPTTLNKGLLLPEDADSAVLAEAVVAGWVLAHKGRMLIFSSEPQGLSDIFYSEPVVTCIGEAIAYFRRERKVFESNKVLLDARSIISDAKLSFSNRGMVEAVESGLYKEVQAFLDAGFSTETEDDNGVPVLSIAVRKGNIEICRLLMSYDASLNIIARDRCSSPVMDAVTSANQDVAELLINAGSDLNFKNKNGQTALIVAIGSKLEDLANLLIEKGADTTMKDSLGMTAAKYAKLFSLSELQKKLEKE